MRFIVSKHDYREIGLIIELIASLVDCDAIALAERRRTGLGDLRCDYIFQKNLILKGKMPSAVQFTVASSNLQYSMYFASQYRIAVKKLESLEGFKPAYRCFTLFHASMLRHLDDLYGVRPGRAI